MRYLCVVHVDPGLMAQLSESDARELVRECAEHDEELRRSGHLIAADALAAPETARIVRMRNQKPMITDGPYAETKEYLGGFIYIEARNIEEAVELSLKFPMAKMGSIEVRPQLRPFVAGE